MDMWPTMSKPNKFYHLVNIKWHSSKFVARSLYTGVNRATNIDHRQESIAVNRNTFNCFSIGFFKAFFQSYSDDNETQIAFTKHFDEELELYKSICIINLVEQSGKEKIMFDAYGNHVVKYNNDNLIYVTFDFHEYW